MKKFYTLMTVVLLCISFTGCLGPSSTSEEKTNSAPTILNLGESFVIDNLQMTVDSYEFSDYLGGLDGLNKVEKGLKYCVVHVTVKNLDNSTKYLTEGTLFKNTKYSSQIIFDKKYEYNSTWAQYTDFFDAHESIPALGEISCCFSYEVAEDVETQIDKQLIFEFGLNKTDTTKKCNWKLR